MNYLKSSTSCRICGVWFEGSWAGATGPARLSIQRQIGNGMCDRCQLRRQAAAVQFIRTTDVVRVFTQLGLVPPGSIAEAARQAEHECMALMMWSPVRRQHDTEKYR